MPTKPTIGITTTGSQRDRRFLDTFHDQHKSQRFPVGRPWTGYREYAANPELGHQPGFVTAELTQGNHEDPFGSNWTAPWIPEFNGGRTGFYEFDYLRKRITIRYDHVLGHDVAAWNAYFDAAAKIAAANGWGEIAFGLTPKFQITSVLGTPPRNPKIAQAAMAGDPWLLGFHDEPNSELAKLLGISTRGLVMQTPTVAPKVTPEAVMAASPADLATMISEIVAKTLAAQQASQPHRRAHRRTKPVQVSQAAPEKGAA
jgi:hypothetical protein